ncbi:MAG TPA: TylF/MycF/NovP-related O-methyltransferase [Candidatus Saccharibacteria bacterium]|nr:TylF/MycF/NovP-related O-methyltransferase [Candidatus Saccharibacteria bacterium]HMT56185.1 TylF/MycF/NovP-related O-methyltransferase [Candidatus Saccharibacteria bacterium]
MKQPRSVTGQVTTEELTIIKRELTTVLKMGIAGDVVELGCYEGGSAVFIQSLLEQQQSEKSLWLYDSFEGLPEKTAEDETKLGAEFQAGELKASKARLERHFHKAGLHLPEIKKAWFYELDTSDLPEQICFAFLDGDYYESILDSFKLVWPKLPKGAVVLVDDYQNPKLPGVKLAVDEWIVSHDGAGLRIESSLAIINA